MSTQIVCDSCGCPFQRDGTLSSSVTIEAGGFALNIFVHRKHKDGTRADLCEDCIVSLLTEKVVGDIEQSEGSLVSKPSPTPDPPLSHQQLYPMKPRGCLVFLVFILILIFVLR